MKNEILIPEFAVQPIVSNTDIWEMNQNVIANLMAEGSSNNRKLAKYLLNYQDIVSNSAFRMEIDNWLNQVYEMMGRKFSRTKATSFSRKKSWMRTLTKGLETLPNGDLTKIYDFFALRIVLHKNNIEELYAVANAVIDYLLAIGLEVISAPPPKNTGFNPEKHSGILIPSKSGLKKSYVKYVKDYVLNPKQNGYQSLHIVVKSPNFPFELQLRTLKQDSWADYLKASHSRYRKEQLSRLDCPLVPIKISDIPIEGIDSGYDEDGDFFVNDQIALLKEVHMLTRIHSGINKSI